MAILIWAIAATIVAVLAIAYGFSWWLEAPPKGALATHQEFRDLGGRLEAESRERAAKDLLVDRARKLNASQKTCQAVTDRLREQIAFELYLGDRVDDAEKDAVHFWKISEPGRREQYLADADKILVAAEGPLSI